MMLLNIACYHWYVLSWKSLTQYEHLYEKRDEMNQWICGKMPTVALVAGRTKLTKPQQLKFVDESIEASRGLLSRGPRSDAESWDETSQPLKCNMEPWNYAHWHPWDERYIYLHENHTSQPFMKVNNYAIYWASGVGFRNRKVCNWKQFTTFEKVKMVFVKAKFWLDQNGCKQVYIYKVCPYDFLINGVI